MTEEKFEEKQVQNCWCKQKQNAKLRKGGEEKLWDYENVKSRRGYRGRSHSTNRSPEKIGSFILIVGSNFFSRGNNLEKPLQQW